MDKRVLEAIATIALVSGIPHCLFATPVGVPPLTYIACLAQLAVLIPLALRPVAAEALLRRRTTLVAMSVLAAAGTAGLHLLPPSNVACQILVAGLGVAEVVWFIGMGLVLADLGGKSLIVAAFGGMEAAFFLATAVLSLPGFLPLVVEVALVALVCPLLAHRLSDGAQAASLREDAARGHDAEHPHRGRGRMRLPVSLVALVFTFSVGMNFLRAGATTTSAWGSTFALAALLAGLIIALEFRVFSNSLFSVLDTAVVIMLAVPLLFLGSGIGCSPIMLTLAAIGFFMVVPRYNQWVIEIAREEGIRPFFGFVVIYLTNAPAQIIGAFLYDGVFTSVDQSAGFTLAVVIAVAIILFGYVPYGNRARDRMMGYLDIEGPHSRSSEATCPQSGDTTLAIGDHAGHPGAIHPGVPDETGSSPSPTPPPAPLAKACASIAAAYGLTKREAEILAFLVQRETISAMAESLCVSTNTVKSHVLHIHQKLGIHSREELAALVACHGGEE